jgi:hypothetical protein
MTLAFSSVRESANRCEVAKQLWAVLSKVFEIDLGGSLDSIGKF